MQKVPVMGRREPQNMTDTNCSQQPGVRAAGNVTLDKHFIQLVVPSQTGYERHTKTLIGIGI